MKIAISPRLAALVFVSLFGARSCPADDAVTPAARWGFLRVEHGQLCSEAGEPVQLRGMSTHDLQRHPFGPETVGTLARDWRASIVRAAMYEDSYGSSYLDHPEVTNEVVRVIDGAISNGIYVLIDWHILQDGDPNWHANRAAAFFRQMSAKYGGSPNALYEICNEPNGTNVTWPVVKRYAEAIIPVIRSNAPRSVIVVGTPFWDQDVRAAARAPLAATNVLYALHFYAGSHKERLRRNANEALALGAALFVSEWGMTDYTGGGAIYPGESQQWMDWLNAHKISWINWSLSTVNEGSAALKPEANINGPWPDDALTPSGLWVREHMR